MLCVIMQSESGLHFTLIDFMNYFVFDSFGLRHVAVF